MIGQVLHLLEQHYIDTRAQSGRIEALEIWVERDTRKPHFDWIDVSGWTLQQAREWLGY